MKSIHVVFDDTTVLQRPVTTVLEILLTNNNMDDNYIHTPFHIAGKLIQMRGFGHRAYWDVFGSITVQCKLKIHQYMSDGAPELWRLLYLLRPY